MADQPMLEKHGRFWVVRDDIYPGGTKQIILRTYLPELKYRHFVYVASAFGKGGAALAHACAELGYKATLFMARAPIQAPWVEAVEKLGTQIIWTKQMPVEKIDPAAWDYARVNDAHYLALGFSQPRFREALISYARQLPLQPQEIWCPVVSGTLAQSLEDAFPEAAMKAVAVVKHHGYQGVGTLYHAPEKYVRGPAIPPPYPSWPYSDAKTWRFANKHGQDGAVIWNSNA